MELSKPYPHYCAVHNLYYGSPTDTIPASMCPLCGIKAELIAQPAPRTYEVARALSWCDAVENSVPAAPQGWQGAAREIDDCFDADGVMHYEGKICVSGDDRERAIEAILKRHQEGKA